MIQVAYANRRELLNLEAKRKNQKKSYISILRSEKILTTFYSLLLSFTHFISEN